MNLNCKIVLLTIFSLIFISFLSSNELNDSIKEFSIKPSNYSSLILEKNKFKNYFTLDSQFGTHRRSVGFNNLFIGYFDIPILAPLFNDFQSMEVIGISGRLGYKHYTLDFGIPGSSDILEGHIKVLYSIGNQNKLYTQFPEIIGYGLHTFSIGYNGYLTTDSTSQVVGQIDYSYTKSNYAFTFNYMNDTIFVYPQDKYRTAAVKLSHYRVFNNNLIGLSLGFSIWAGERKFDLNDIWNDGNIDIPDEVSRGETVTLYNGKEYATNIVYGAITFNNISLSVGYDSEIFKQLIHNNIHYLIDDGNLPSIDRDDKFYIEVKIGLQDLLF